MTAMRRDTDRRRADRGQVVHERPGREQARAVERGEAVRLVEDLSRLGPGHEGLMALALRGMEAEGLLDGPTLLGLYGRAMQTMGVEAANRVFLGEGLGEPDVAGAVRAIRSGEDTRAYETEDLAGEMAGRLGLDAEVDIRLGEEGRRRAGAAGAAGVEQGKVIYLDERRFDPRTREGREVLGHEVAHVAQVEKGRVAAGPGAAEIEAARVGEALADGATVQGPTVSVDRWAVAAHGGVEAAGNGTGSRGARDSKRAGTARQSSRLLGQVHDPAGASGTVSQRVLQAGWPDVEKERLLESLLILYPTLKFDLGSIRVVPTIWNKVATIQPR